MSSAWPAPAWPLSSSMRREPRFFSVHPFRTQRCPLPVEPSSLAAVSRYLAVGAVAAITSLQTNLTVALATQHAGAAGTDAVPAMHGRALEYLLIPLISAWARRLYSCGDQHRALDKNRAPASRWSVMPSPLRSAQRSLSQRSAAGVACAIQSRSACDRDGQRLSADRRAGVWILWPGHALYFASLGAARLMAPVGWILRVSLTGGAGCASPNRLTQLAVRSTAFSAWSSTVSRYGRDHIRSVVCRELTDARLALMQRGLY